MHALRSLLTHARHGWSRREFVGVGLAGMVVGLVGNATTSAAATLKARMYADSIYQRLLGVIPHLPGHGHTTVFGGSRMPAEVTRAIADANEYFVDMHELFAAAGRRIAEVTGAEAGLVTSGSFSSLLLGAAGCLTGTDQTRMEALPQVTWERRECLTQTAHRVDYDRAYRSAGMTIVAVETREQLRNAIGPKTAMLHCLASMERKPGRTDREMLPAEFVEIGRRAGVPVFVDSASELPPAKNLTRFVEMGADLVAISGGKGIRGPQGTGMLVGRRDLIEAARLNAFPHSHIGRGMKVGKETVIGLIVALNRFVELDHEAMDAVWTRTTKYVAEQLQGVPGLTAEYVQALDTPLGYDSVRLTWDPQVIPLTLEEAQQRLQAGEPRVIFRSQYFITRNLDDGEEVVVAKRLRTFFMEEAHRRPAPVG